MHAVEWLMNDINDSQGSTANYYYNTGRKKCSMISLMLDRYSKDSDDDEKKTSKELDQAVW